MAFGGGIATEKEESKGCEEKRSSHDRVFVRLGRAV